MVGTLITSKGRGLPLTRALFFYHQHHHLLKAINIYLNAKQYGQTAVSPQKPQSHSSAFPTPPSEVLDFTPWPPSGQRLTEWRCSQLPSAAAAEKDLMQEADAIDLIWSRRKVIMELLWLIAKRETLKGLVSDILLSSDEDLNQQLQTGFWLDQSRKHFMLLAT